MSTTDTDWVTVREIASTKERKGLLPYSRSKIYEDLAKGAFIAPARLSARKCVWRRTDIIAWRDSKFPAPALAAMQEGAK